MILIPVVDLLGGQVVHALRGDRRAYRPVVSALCAGSDPVTVARRLCAHCAARRLYVADLDALLGGVPQVPVLRALLQALPAVKLWLDAGLADPAAVRALHDHIGPAAARIVTVFGSESLRTPQQLERCFGNHQARRRAVLSLDRRAAQPLDPAGCWDAPQHWPRRVIMMTLDRVGADAGPDLRTLAELKTRSPTTVWIGAGGIRNEADLADAHKAGAAAWLVASALHHLRLAPREA